MNKSIPLLFYSCILLLCLLNCTHISDESTDIVSKILPNGKHLVVEKTNRETTSIGIITKHNYGSTHSFSYKIVINEGSIEWSGGSGEPKHLLFCDDAVYIHYLKNKWVEEPVIDSLNQSPKRYYRIQDHYQAYIDNRYFFKLLGDAYWVETTLENYTKQKSTCDEFEVPNDNELVL